MGLHDGYILQPAFPVKVLLSPKPMPDSGITPEALAFTKNELKMIKDLNIVLLNTKDPL